MLWSGIGGRNGTSWNSIRRSPLMNWFLPGTKDDYKSKAGDLWKNSVVGIALNWIMGSFPEAPLNVATVKNEGNYNWFPNHPMALKIRRPNAHYGARTLWAGTILSWLCDGNAYWYKARDRFGRVQELWYIPHYEMEPRWPEDGKDLPGQPGSGFISHYERWIDGEWHRIEKKDIVHFRYGIDPDWNGRKGLAPLKSQLRQVFSDNEYSTYVASIIANFGICSILISTTDPDYEMDDEEAEKNKKLIHARTVGDERGKPLIIPSPIKVDKLAWSPEEMALDRMIKDPVARICGALLLDPMVLGLPSDTNVSYDNREQAERGAWNNAICPWMEMLCETLDIQLLPEFNPRSEEQSRFDTRNVRALQQDEDVRWNRYVNAYFKGSIRRLTLLQALGLDYDEKRDDVYYTDVQMQIADAHQTGDDEDATDKKNDQQTSKNNKVSPKAKTPNAVSTKTSKRSQQELDEAFERLMSYQQSRELTVVGNGDNHGSHRRNGST